MAMENGKPAPVGETRSATSSRRHALALMLGAWGWLPRALAAADPGAPVRIAISESTVADVNLDDARASMLIWIKRVMLDWNVTIELDPKVFDTTEEILRRARRGQVDSVAVNLLEYRQIADVLDSTQIVIEAGDSGPDLYILAAKRDSGIQHLSDLRGRRLCTWKAPRMCLAPAWLTAILDEGHFGPSEQFFDSATTETKPARVVLPVFFGQADACITSKRSFDTMCELNPQVAKDLTAIASSPVMVPLFYCFHKNYHSANRERFVKALTGLRASAAGRQIATLFQCDGLTTADASCLADGLGILDAAERARNRRGAGGRKG
jgi:phosphonate transport system substrate-binding protein